MNPYLIGLHSLTMGVFYLEVMRSPKTLRKLWQMSNYCSTEQKNQELRGTQSSVSQIQTERCLYFLLKNRVHQLVLCLIKQLQLNLLRNLESKYLYLTDMNSYDLSRNFCNWAFDNPEKVKPIHYAIYFFSIEHCNRLGWKDKFGLPSQMVMEAIGVKNWRTYSAGLNDLVEFGFIEMIETSKNQYSSNIIAIVNFTKAPTKALDKALSKHSTKHSQSTVSIDKQETKNNKQYRAFAHLSITVDDFNRLEEHYTKQQIDSTLDSIENYKKNTQYKSLYLTAKKWLSKEPTKQLTVVNEDNPEAMVEMMRQRREQMMNEFRTQG